jgi:hypothetical protein
MFRAMFLSALLAPSFIAVQPPSTPAPVTPAAGPIVSIKKAIQAEAGDLVEVVAESGAELVTWDASDGLKIVYPKSDPAQKTVYVHTKTQGTYALVASIPNGKETRAAICIVQVGPPQPAPVPGFQERLQAAFTADAATPQQAALLAALYRKAATSTVRDPGLATGAALLAEMQRAVKLLGLPAGSLAKTARAIADELNVSFANAAALDIPTRDRLAAAFVRIADALEKLTNG